MTGHQLGHCGHCNGAVPFYFSDMWRCTHCNSPSPPAVAQHFGRPAAAPGPGAALAGHVVAMVGGVIVALSPFLPWVTAGIFSASGLQKAGNEALTLVALGLLAALVGLLVLVRAAHAGGLVHVLLAIVSLALLAFYHSALKDHIASLESDVIRVELGVGIYVGFIGAVLMLVGGIAALSAGKRNPA